MDEFLASSFSSVEPDYPQSLTHDQFHGFEPEEYRALFDAMCHSYDELRLQAHSQKVAENEFMPRIGAYAPCFLDNPRLFMEVHALWCEDYNRAQMYRVDPFQTTLQLLRSHLNPVFPKEL